MNKLFSELSQSDQEIALNKLAEKRMELFTAAYDFVYAITPENILSTFYRPFIIQHLNRKQFNENLELVK